MRDLLRREAGRLTRFGMVGLLTTGLHMLIALGLVSALGWPVQRANLVAFACALMVSFLGHHHWSFRSDAGYGRTGPRFLLAAGAGYGASVVLIALLGPALPGNRQLVVVIGGLAIPAVSYLANRLFVFR